MAGSKCRECLSHRQANPSVFGAVMFSIHDRPYRLCDGVSRREVLRVGGLGLGGLTLPGLLAAAQAGPQATREATFGKAKNVIFLFLAGGPPQHETFDPKPDAPVEIRGPFKPISTNVPGIHFCELLPRTARLADKLAIVRSMATDDHIHSSSGHWVLTGHKYVGPNRGRYKPRIGRTSARSSNAWRRVPNCQDSRRSGSRISIGSTRT